MIYNLQLGKRENHYFPEGKRSKCLASCFRFPKASSESANVTDAAVRLWDLMTVTKKLLTYG